MTRRWRHLRAWMGGYYWLPCVVCGKYHAGYERGKHGLPDSVPNLGNPGSSTIICPRCADAGYGWELGQAMEAWSW